MVTALAVRDDSAPTMLAPRTITELIELAERLSKSSLLPAELRNKPADVMMSIMAGAELGLHAMASFRSFNVIAGKPVMTADVMVALALRCPDCEYFRRISESDKAVTYATKRRGDPERTCTWTMEMAKTASLHLRDNWRGYPRAMLASRAKSELARDVYPDVLAGCYTPDEVDDRSPSAPVSDAPDAPDAVDAEFTDVRSAVEDAPPAPTSFSPADYPEIADIDAAQSIEELKAIAGKFAARKLGPGIAYDTVNAHYKARLQELKRPKPTPPEAPATPTPTPTESTT